MKLAILSDIHGNLPALQTVTAHIEQWKPDHVIVNGDVVNRGTQPTECLQLLLAKEWQITEGNHEGYVNGLYQTEATETPIESALNQHCRWHIQQLGDAVQAVQGLPTIISLHDPLGGEIRVTHGSMLGNRAGIYPYHTNNDIIHRMGEPPKVFCVGHTHRPFIRQVNGTTVINSGAVGLPFDGDWHACYTQLHWHNGEWQAELVRLPYDRPAAERTFYETGFLAEGGEMVRLFLRELQISRPLVFSWTNRYLQAVKDGEISIADSIGRTLTHYE